jgi:glycosyltransferase involved in cell wall biosynthesis
VRIAIVNNYARVTGGADRHCFDLAVGLRRLGHEVTFLATSSPDNLETSGAFVSSEMTRDNRDSIRGVAAARVALRSLWNRESAAAMHQLARDFEPDVIHAHKLYPQLSVAPVAVASRLGVPIAQTVHDYELISASALDATGSALDRHESSLRYRTLNDASFPFRRLVHAPRVDRWVAVSRSVAGHLASKGIHADVIPNFAGAAVAPSMREGQRTGVAYVGRLAQEKGVTDVLELALAMPDIQVTVAGHGPLAGAVRRRAEQLQNLDYLGSLSRKRVLELIARSLVLLMPSRWEEPGPLAALEAMSAGTPVIAYRAGGLAEYVEDAGAGAVIRASTADLVHTVKELLSDVERWRRYSGAGREAIETQHSPEHCIRMYERVYEELVSHPRP